MLSDGGASDGLWSSTNVLSFAPTSVAPDVVTLVDNVADYGVGLDRYRNRVVRAQLELSSGRAAAQLHE